MNQTLPSYHITYRRTPIILIGELLLSEIIAGVISLFGIAALNYWGLEDRLSFQTVIQYEVLIFIVVSIFLILVAIVVFINWFNSTIIIYPGVIIKARGFMNVTHSEYFLEEIEKTNIHQDIFGKLFKYGTVLIYKNAIDPDMSYQFISDPHEFIRLVNAAANNP